MLVFHELMIAIGRLLPGSITAHTSLRHKLEPASRHFRRRLEHASKRGDGDNDGRHTPTSDQAPTRRTNSSTALQIGLVALLVYGCSRIIMPFTGILLWSAILAIMLYPLHLRLVGRLAIAGRRP